MEKQSKMPLRVPSCLANDPDVRRMAEKVIIIIINVMMADQVRKEEERKARLEKELREKERQVKEVREKREIFLSL